MNDKILMEMGMTRTIYSLLYKEVHNLLKNFTQKYDCEDFTKSYTGKLDNVENIFIDKWKAWASNNLSAKTFPHAYMTAGSSEAIRTSISKLMTKSTSPVVLVFEGEYEGYQAFCTAYNIPVVKIKRTENMREMYDNIKNILDPLKDYTFYISQPSSIDGNVWEQFPQFLNIMENLKIDVKADGCYIGSLVTNDYFVNFDHPAISEAFFSISKTFGVYYARIGMVFSKEPIPELYAQRWFKNIISIRLGIALLDTFPANSLPMHYAKVRDELISNLPYKINPSQVLMLGNIENPTDELRDFLYRGTDNCRVCLTPGLDKLINK